MNKTSDAMDTETVSVQTGHPDPRCAVCAAGAADRTQLMIGPAEAICDVCVNEANVSQGSWSASAHSTDGEVPVGADALAPSLVLCTFCGETTHPIVFGFDPGQAGGGKESPSQGERTCRTICRGCLDLFNQVLYEAVGREALAQSVRSQVERDYFTRIRETDRLELDLMNRRSVSIQHELLSYNLELLLRNVDGIMERADLPGQALRYIPMPLRRRAVQRLDELAQRLADSLPEALRPRSHEFSARNNAPGARNDDLGDRNDDLGARNDDVAPHEEASDRGLAITDLPDPDESTE